MLGPQPSLSMSVCVGACAHTAYLKVEACSKPWNDAHPAGLQTEIYSVRFDFYLNTNTHVLFIAFRWRDGWREEGKEGLCVGLHYYTAVCARGCMAAGAHAPSATARLGKLGGSSSTRRRMGKKKKRRCLLSCSIIIIALGHLATLNLVDLF